jgi:hypothetical protein
VDGVILWFPLERIKQRVLAQRPNRCDRWGGSLPLLESKLTAAIRPPPVTCDNYIFVKRYSQKRLTYPEAKKFKDPEGLAVLCGCGQEVIELWRCFQSGDDGLKAADGRQRRNTFG